MNTSALKKTLVVLAVYVSLPVLLLTTDPQKLPLPLLFLPIILVYAACALSVYLAFSWLRPGMDNKKRRFIALFTGTLPTLLVILQTIQQLSIRDLLIVVILFALLVWYMQKADMF